MGRPKNSEIIKVWDHLEAKEPDRSTEYLFARVLDHFEHTIDSADIAQALVEKGRKPCH